MFSEKLYKRFRIGYKKLNFCTYLGYIRTNLCSLVTVLFTPYIIYTDIIGK